MTDLQPTAQTDITLGADPRVVALYDEGVKLLAYAEARVILSDQDIRTATDDLALIAGLKKAMEEKRQEYVRPINEHLRAVNDRFKLFAEPFIRADDITRRKVMDYRAEQNRIQQEQERINRLRMEAAQAEMRLKGELSEPVTLVEVQPDSPARYRADAGTLGTARVWKFEVVDFALLPAEYKLADLARIRKVVTAGASIPGVRAWQEESLRVTTR